jgi:hypothetical protein
MGVRVMNLRGSDKVSSMARLVATSNGSGTGDGTDGRSYADLNGVDMDDDRSRLDLVENDEDFDFDRDSLEQGSETDDVDDRE